MSNWWDDPDLQNPQAPAPQEKPRGVWDRFKDSFLNSALHSPFGAEGAARLYLKHVEGYTDDQINAAEKRLSDEYARKQTTDPAFKGKGFDIVSPSNIGRAAVDLVGNVIGGADPTYALNPGSSVARRIAAQGAINAGMDAASQGVEIHRGVRDKFDPAEVGLNAAAGAVFQGGNEVVHGAKAARMIAQGAKHPMYNDIVNTIIGLEGGGTLEHPKTSPKGAMGVMQVMPETARKPGFGIRPWNGKTQADLARVGRQYAAALTHKYGGDKAKILAAYNAGPGKVDGLIKKYGEDWYNHLPRETRKYVADGTMRDADARYAERDDNITEFPISDKRWDDMARSYDDLHTLEGPVWDFRNQRWVERDADGVIKEDLKDTLDRTSLTDEEKEKVLRGENIENKDYIPELDDPVTPEERAADDFQAHFDNVLDSRQEVFDRLRNGEDVKLPQDQYEKELREIRDMINEANRTPEYQKYIPQLKLYHDLWQNVGEHYGYNTDLSKKIVQFPGERVRSLEEADPMRDFDNRLNQADEDFKAGKITKEDYDKIIEEWDAAYSNKHRNYAPNQGDNVFGLENYKESNRRTNLKKISNWISQHSDALEVALEESKRGISPLTPREAEGLIPELESIERLVRALKRSRGVDMGEVNKVHLDLMALKSKTSGLIEEIKKNFVEPVVPTRPIDNIGYEKHTPYVGDPKAPANDPAEVKRSFVQLMKDLWNDESGSIRIGRDNPGGEWEAHKQERADKEGHTWQGAVTAYTTSPVDVPVSILKTFKGANNENPRPGQIKFDRLQKSVDEKGWEDNHPILVRVNHRGEGYILEGNNRVAMADKLGIPTIKAQVDWVNGGEKSSNRLLDIIKEMLKDDSGSGINPLDLGDGEGRNNEGTDYSPVDKLRQALRDAQPIRDVQETMYSRARSKKVEQAADVGKRTSGEEGLYAEMRELGGALPKANYESIRGQFTQEDLDGLFNQIKNSPRLSYYESIRARVAFAKMIGDKDANYASVPTDSEIQLLGKVFPKELIEEILRKKPLKDRVLHNIVSGLNVPRSLMASMDLSAPFRQGVFLVGRKEFWTSFDDMFKAFGSEKAFQAIQDEISSRPTYRLMKKGRLALSGADHVLYQREEAFMSDLAEKIPVAGRLVRASTRAYEGFLNKLRADTFDRMVKLSKDAGIDIEHDQRALKDITRFINAATGRGDLGKLNQAAPILSAAFFSPRLAASRIQMLTDPRIYMASNPVVRKEAIKSLMAFIGIQVAGIGLLSMATGGSVNIDPRSSDFAKVKVGNTRIDTLGGFQQYIRLASVLATGKEVGSNGKVRKLNDDKVYKGDTYASVLGRFARGKESPVASFIHDNAAGKDIVGKKVKYPEALYDRFIPLVAQDVRDVAKEKGYPAAAALGTMAVFGVGLQTYETKKEGSKKQPKNWWDDPDLSPKSSSKKKEWWEQ